VLFGLYDWRFEVLGLVAHALHLQARYGVGPHTISFPRLRPAQGVIHDNSHLVSDHDFKRLVAILRLAVPYTGLILTAREEPALRRAVLAFGVSQIDAGSRLEVGGYTEAGDAQSMEREQFELGDIRPLDQVMRELARGRLPTELLHGVLSPGPHRRAFHGVRDSGFHQAFLHAQRADNPDGVPG
jgi:2-iminoacetate synthase